MDFLFSLTAWQFAAAGAIAAAGPVLIHLLNRRRYRTVQWAAMDFLREALQRNRRMMQIRDLLLLLLRTAAVLLFGLALARPFLSSSEESFENGQPLHGILLVDNSLSMGYESLDGTLLERAKERARQFIEKLPPGSKYSIIPICGSRDGYSPDPYDTADNALEALDKIEIVDRSASVLRAVNEAKRASEGTSETLSKRIVLFSDQQAANWRDLAGAEQLKELPAMQLVDVSPAEWENTWISEVKIPDGLADIETPTTIVVELQHQGPAPRRDVQVTLSMGDTVIGEKTVTIDPGVKEVDFQYVFNTLSEMPEPDRPVFVPLKASIAPDRLAADDERYLAVPVVAALPVVFVDQYGAEREDPIRNRLGETRHLRAYLAPRVSRTEAARHLVKIRHLTPEDLTQDALADARMVVVAGIREPGPYTAVLRDYVKQGGQLILAAGADFDPRAWTEGAWNEGAGILPMPLDSEPIGETPEAAGRELNPMFLSYESFSGEDYFLPPSASESELRDLYAEAFFFKAVAPQWDDETQAAWEQAERKRLQDELTFVAEAAKRREEFAIKESKGEITEEDRRQLADDDARLREMRPQWLTWASSNAAIDDRAAAEADVTRQVEAELQRSRPRILARYSDENGPAFLVERKVGQGHIMFVSTGLLSSWNTLPKTNVMFVFDRILRSMTQSTLPRRNYEALDRLTLPLPSQDPDVAVMLQRPLLASAEPLDVGYIGQEQRGVTISDLYQRGVYRVAAYRTLPASADPAVASSVDEKPVWEIPLAVNGSGEESQLAPLARDKFDEVAEGSQLRWIGPGEEISLAGTAIRGQSSWWWLVLLVLVVLLVEMLILAVPMLRSGTSADASTT